MFVLMKGLFAKWSAKFGEHLYTESNKINEYEGIMTVDTIIIRLHKIIGYLRSRPRTYEEISNLLDIDSEATARDLRISKRSLQRDIQNIRTIYGIDIKFNEAIKKYKLAEDVSTNHSPTRILGHLDILMALTSKNTLPNTIILQEHQDTGTGQLAPILEAIYKGLNITFLHTNISTGDVKSRKLNPYGLKEHDQRWYVFGYDLDKKSFRLFSLDRISHLELTDIAFEKPENIADFFKYAYGVEVALEEKPSLIQITVTNHQAQFLKALPIHHSQKIIFESDSLTTFEFLLVPKHNFIMKLLSFGSDLLNVEPKLLRESLILRTIKILENLKHD